MSTLFSQGRCHLCYYSRIIEYLMCPTRISFFFSFSFSLSLFFYYHMRFLVTKSQYSRSTFNIWKYSLKTDYGMEMWPLVIAKPCFMFMLLLSNLFLIFPSNWDRDRDMLFLLIVLLLEWLSTVCSGMWSPWNDETYIWWQG